MLHAIPAYIGENKLEIIFINPESIAAIISHERGSDIYFGSVHFISPITQAELLNLGLEMHVDYRICEKFMPQSEPDDAGLAPIEDGAVRSE